MKGGPRRAHEAEKSLQGDRFAGTRVCRVYRLVFTLVDPWWTRREAPRMDAARRGALATTASLGPPQSAEASAVVTASVPGVLPAPIVGNRTLDGSRTASASLDNRR